VKITKHLSERSFLILAILWAIGITLGSLISLNNIPKLSIPGKDKTVHFIFYFVFVLFWFLALKSKVKNKNFHLVLVFAAVFYGITIEVMQSLLTENRQADFYDIIANTFGAIFGIFIISVFLNKK
jgi:VanZ family protein